MEGYGENVVLIAIGRGPPHNPTIILIFNDYFAGNLLSSPTASPNGFGKVPEMAGTG